MAAITGHVDGFEGVYVTGWALGPDKRDGTAKISICTAAGAEIASGHASIERPDLRNISPDRAAGGFRVPVQLSTPAEKLFIYADGQELLGSPVAFGAGQYDGRLRVKGGRASGWVTERALGLPRPMVTLIDQDGTELGRVRATASEDRPDPFFDPSNFAFDLGPAWFGRKEIHLRAQAGDRVIGRAHASLGLMGTLEICEENHFFGWLFCPERPDCSIPLELYADGVCIARGSTGLVRQDVEAVHKTCGKPGFRLQINPPLPAKLTELRLFSLRIAGTARELFEGPFLLGSRAAAIAATRAGLQATQRLAATGQTAAAALIADAVRKTLPTLRQAPRFHLAAPMLHVSQPGQIPARPARLNIIIPVYKGLDITRVCIQSVINFRKPGRDRVVIVNDRSPEPGMPEILGYFATLADVFVLHNTENLGFIGAVNRGMEFCNDGDILLLNSDTELLNHAFDEMLEVAYAAPDIGSVTALSNNATIFSYPHVTLATMALSDITWPEVASIFAEYHKGTAIDMPTGHGFCLLLRQDVVARVGRLDEIFGRGYGEENDFCAKAADLGYRNVAAPGAFVLHKESVSFGPERQALIAKNIPILESRYPEYTPIVMAAEQKDPLRLARHTLDRHRLHIAADSGTRFVLEIVNWLEGGTARAARDIASLVGFGGLAKLTLHVRADGFMELSGNSPVLHAVFAADEVLTLFDVLPDDGVTLLIVHQLLGFSADFIETLGNWARRRRGIYYAHDFYPLCPRVTMLDALDEFCDTAAPEICANCVRIGGAHFGSRLGTLPAAEHRGYFAGILSSFTHVVAPSSNTAAYYKRVFPGQKIVTLPHPHVPGADIVSPARGGMARIALIGAIGPHKGSRQFLALARRAEISAPHLHFTVIGYTDLDEELKTLANVTITGPYQPAALPGLLAEAKSGVALFLHIWPETFSYTLSEAVAAGLVPVVPEIGAPAERVAASGFGFTYKFPLNVKELLGLLQKLAAAPDMLKGLTKAAATTLAAGSDPALTKVLFGEKP